MLSIQCSAFHFLSVCLITGCLLLSGYSKTIGQSLIFSQYYASPLNINPAMAGTYRHTHMNVSYRSQWRDMNNPYQAQMFSLTHPIVLHQPVEQHIGNISFSAFSENAGFNQLYKSWGINVGTAYNVSLDYQQNYVLMFGLEGGVVQKSIDLSGLQWGSQYNPYIGYDFSITSPIAGVADQRRFPVFNAGFLWFYNPSRQYLLKNYSAFFGMSVANLNRPDISISSDKIKSPLVMKIHGGLEYALSSRLRILPSTLAIFTSQQKYYLNIGVYLHHKASAFDLPDKIDLTLLGGAWYRWNDSFVFSGGFDVEHLTVAASIDLNQGKAYMPSMYGGAFEVTIAYKILRKSNGRRFYTPMI